MLTSGTLSFDLKENFTEFYLNEHERKLQFINIRIYYGLLLTVHDPDHSRYLTRFECGKAIQYHMSVFTHGQQLTYIYENFNYLHSSI